ncbi:MAG: Sec-independent protein translocase protein TatB [Acetobacteraceae bacterium]
MFDFAWSELGVIAVVALIFIGPKDMPVALKSVTGMIKKARRMASEFQTHVDDMVRDADLHEVRDQISALRGYTVKGALEKFVDEDGSIRRSFDDPFTPAATTMPEATIAGDVAVAERVEIGTEIVADSEPEPAATPPRPATPAFIPPSAAPLADATAAAVAPAFIPPEFARVAPSRPTA